MGVSIRVSMRWVVVAAGFAVAVGVSVLMDVLLSMRCLPVGTGLAVFVEFGFGVVGVRHGGFLVRFVV
ncbi:hypothetical protein [Paraburkholderia lacunae]|uniref:hypothetical protein n=1 Tax=Paraburkholderia lacunae TaxID=2211104 RepID=UPI001FCB57F0|nr:hypothetical protein [Paraburkholderia lacunae]